MMAEIDAKLGVSGLGEMIGSPWGLLNFTDFLLIGVFALIFFMILHVAAMGWHRLTLYRATGSSRSAVIVPFPGARNQQG